MSRVITHTHTHTDVERQNAHTPTTLRDRTHADTDYYGEEDMKTLLIPIHHSQLEDKESH